MYQDLKSMECVKELKAPPPKKNDYQVLFPKLFLPPPTNPMHLIK